MISGRMAPSLGKAEQLEIIGREHRQVVDRAQRVAPPRRQLEAERSKAFRRLVDTVAHVDDDVIEDRREVQPV